MSEVTKFVKISNLSVPEVLDEEITSVQLTISDYEDELYDVEDKITEMEFADTPISEKFLEVLHNLGIYQNRESIGSYEEIYEKVKNAFNKTPKQVKFFTKISKLYIRKNELDEKIKFLEKKNDALYEALMAVHKFY